MKRVIDYGMLAVSLVTLWLIYLILTEEDSDKRRLMRLSSARRQYQKAAEYFGGLALESEKEYNRILDGWPRS